MDKLQIRKVAHLSHAINTPLTTVLGYLGLIKKRCSNDGEIIKWGEIIKKEVLKVSKYSKEINKLASGGGD